MTGFQFQVFYTSLLIPLMSSNVYGKKKLYGLEVAVKQLYLSIPLPIEICCIIARYYTVYCFDFLVQDQWLDARDTDVSLAYFDYSPLIRLFCLLGRVV